MRFIPFALLAAAAGWLASQWDDLPAQWVVHWGPGGVPDGYVSRTFAGVFGPLIFGAVLAVFLELVASFTERATRKHVPQLARAYGNFVRWVAIAQACAISTIAVLLPLQRVPSPRVLVGGLLGLVGLALLAGALGARRSARQLAEQGQSLPKGYGPLIYRNPEDPRLIVPKLVGIGWTFNFAHRSAWLLLALLLLPVLVVLAVVFTATG
jgi:uncharacterized membrane protein